MNEDYLLQGEQLELFLNLVSGIIDTKVTYTDSKLKMAEECIGLMRANARLLELKLLKLKSTCTD